MKVIEKPWRYGMQLAYADVEPEYLAFEKGIRVLPARYFYEKKLYFTLISRHEPGEDKTLPNGGFHVRSEAGGWYSFELDQVIVHPLIIENRRRRTKMERRVEQLKQAQTKKEKVSTDGKTERRGRPSLPPEERLRRENERKQKQLEAVTLPDGTKRKRGRPSKGDTTPRAPKVPSGGKRGRPSLPTAVKEQRAKQIEQKLTVNPDRKRGRPSNPAKKQERERQAAQRLESNPERRRGRPPGIKR